MNDDEVSKGKDSKVVLHEGWRDWDVHCQWISKGGKDRCLGRENVKVEIKLIWCVYIL